MRKTYMLILREQGFKRLLLTIGMAIMISLLYVFPCLAETIIMQTEQANESATLDESTPTNNFVQSDSIDVHVVETPLVDTTISGISAFLSFFAIVISICSVVITRKMTRDTIDLQIQHNLDEVRPILNIHFDANEMSIIIKNHGMGPAYLTFMEWSDENSSAPTLNTLNTCKWNKYNADHFYVYTKSFLDNKEDPDVLAPQESLCFIRGKLYDRDNNKRIAMAFAGVQMQLVYTDMYRSKEWVIKKDCSWFYYQFL